MFWPLFWSLPLMICLNSLLLASLTSKVLAWLGSTIAKSSLNSKFSALHLLCRFSSPMRYPSQNYVGGVGRACAFPRPLGGDLPGTAWAKYGRQNGFVVLVDVCWRFLVNVDCSSVLDDLSCCTVKSQSQFQPHSRGVQSPTGTTEGGGLLPGLQKKADDLCS